MNKVQKFQDLEVWQRAHQLVLDIYQITQQFPTKERYGLTSQLQRAAISVPANIAEGFKRRGNADKIKCVESAGGIIVDEKIEITVRSRFIARGGAKEE